MEDSELRLRFACPHCGKRIAAPPNLAGKRLQCPNKECGEVVSVPVAQPLGVQPSQPTHAVTPTVEPSAPVQVQPLDAESAPEPIAKRSGRKKRKKRAASSSSWKIGLLVGGGVVAAVAIVVVGLVLWLGGDARRQATQKPAGEDKPIVADSGKPPAAAPDVKKEPDPAKVKPAPTPPVKAAEPVAPVKPPPPAPPPAATVPPPPAKPPVVTPPEEEKPKLLQEFVLLDRKNAILLSAVAVSKDGTQVLCSGGALSSGASLWDIEKGAVIRRFDALKTAANSLALSPDGRRALFGCEDGSLRLWDVTKAKELRVIRGDVLSGARSVVYSPDGRLAASGGGGAVDTVVRLWDAATVKALGTFKGHKGGPPPWPFPPTAASC